MKRVILKSCSVVLLLLGLANIADYIYASAATNATTSNLSMQATILPSMTVVIDDTNPTLNITPSSTGTFDSTSINVYAYSNGSIGYNLTMTPSDTDLTGISTGSTIPTLTSGSYTSANFPTGYWGVAVDSGNYVPAAVTNLATVNANNANVATNTHAVNLAANLDLTTAMDSYSTTLTFAATATVQTYPITFNFYSNITSLAIKDANNVTKATITTSGSSVNLDFASTYTIVPTYAINDGFTVGWLSPSTGYYNNNNLTYTVGSGSTTVNLASLVYMQDLNTLSASSLAGIKSAMESGKQYQLKDNRDQKPYYVARLADGNIWMTQNLDHDIVTTQDFYTYNNTDIGHGSTPNTQATWTAPTATYVSSNTTWNGLNYEPESYDPGDVCWNGAYGYLDIATGTTACGNDRHMHIGNYYNWTAAVAMDNSSSYTTEQDVNQSICPAGWRLPTLNGDKSYDYLARALSLTSGASGNVQKAPVYFVYSGDWHGSTDSIGRGGNYWISVVNVTRGAYEYYFGRTGYNYAMDYDYRHLGDSVRCVAR